MAMPGPSDRRMVNSWPFRRIAPSDHRCIDPGDRARLGPAHDDLKPGVANAALHGEPTAHLADAIDGHRADQRGGPNDFERQHADGVGEELQPVPAEIVTPAQPELGDSTTNHFVVQYE